MSPETSEMDSQFHNLASFSILYSIFGLIFSGLLGLPLGLLLLVLGHGLLLAEPRNVRGGGRRLSGLRTDHRRLPILPRIRVSSENLALGLGPSGLAVGDALQRREVLVTVLQVPVLHPGVGGRRSGDGLVLAVLEGLEILPDPLADHLDVLTELGVADLVVRVELGLEHDVRGVVVTLREFQNSWTARIVFVGDDAGPAFDEVVSESARGAVMVAVVEVVGTAPPSIP